MLCFGTTQDIPAGLYQPEFQDTASLSYEATALAKNTRTHNRNISAKTKKTYPDRGQKEKAGLQAVKELNASKDNNNFLICIFEFFKE